MLHRQPEPVPQPAPVLLRIHGRHAHAGSAPAAPAVQQAAATAAEPSVQPAEIHITHDRKQHHSTTAGPPGGGRGPADDEAGGAPAGKATSSDFLTSFADASKSVAAQTLADDDADHPGLPGVKQALVKPAPVKASPLVTNRHALDPIRPPTAEAAERAPKVEEQVLTPEIGLPALFTARGKLIVPPAMKGSHDILVHQNIMADNDGLDRVQDDADLLRMRAAHLLVALPVSAAIEVDDRLPADRRFARPWTVQFLNDLARAHYSRFHESLQVNSAVRTVAFQQRLIRTNGNAAPAEGQTASPHLTGQAVDIAKHGLSMTEIAWLRGYLLPLVQEGKVDVEEEFQQACFHISVYKRYSPLPGKLKPDEHRPSVAASLATAIH